MIYEHHGREGRFFIEWNEPRAWGYSQETKWVGTHKGAVLALGSAPEAVLDVMLEMTSRPRADGSSALSARLPSTLAEWRASRD